MNKEQTQVYVNRVNFINAALAMSKNGKITLGGVAQACGRARTAFGTSAHYLDIKEWIHSLNTETPLPTPDAGNFEFNSRMDWNKEELFKSVEDACETLKSQGKTISIRSAAKHVGLSWLCFYKDGMLPARQIICRHQGKPVEEPEPEPDPKPRIRQVVRQGTNHKIELLPLAIHTTDYRTGERKYCDYQLFLKGRRGDWKHRGYLAELPPVKQQEAA